MSKSSEASSSRLPVYPWPAERMTTAEVAATIGKHPKTVREHIRAGRLRAVQLEPLGPYMVHRDDAQSWLEALIVSNDAREGVDRNVSRRRSALAGVARPEDLVRGGGRRGA